MWLGWVSFGSPSRGIQTEQIGHESNHRLLETRHWVLEQAGLKVITATERSHVEQLLTSQCIDIFILCHTLYPEESDAALLIASVLRPEMKNLVLTANTPLGSLGSHEQIVSAFEGPRALLAVVERLLTADPSKSLIGD